MGTVGIWDRNVKRCACTALAQPSDALSLHNPRLNGYIITEGLGCCPTAIQFRGGRGSVRVNVRVSVRVRRSLRL